MSPYGTRPGADYDNVAVCSKDPYWRLERWEDLTDDLLAQTHLARADELLVARGAGQDLGDEWEPDGYYGDVAIYRRTGPVPDAGPPSGEAVMRSVTNTAGVEPNIIYCTQALRDRELESDGVSFRVAPRYQGVWPEEAHPLSKTRSAQMDAQMATGSEQRLKGGGNGQRSARVEIGIVDTGIAQGQYLGPGLEGAVASQWLVSSESSDLPDPDGNRRIEPPTGHGTFVSGVIARIEPYVRIHIIRAVGRYGAVSDLRLAEAIDTLVGTLDAAGIELDILNLSLGSWTYDDKPPLLAGRRIAELPGRTLVVAAAGNLESRRPFWPAAIKRVVGVGAVMRDGVSYDASEYSNYGSWVKAVAPDGGERVPGARSEGGQESTYFSNFPPGDPHPRYHGWARWRGTSFTAPKVAGMIAKQMVDHDLTTAQEGWERLRAASPDAPSYKFPKAVLVTTPEDDAGLYSAPSAEASA
jgi:hypothetical protein